MKYLKQSIIKFVAAAVVMIMMAIAASRQLYLFVVFRDADGNLGVQGGKYHLWLATGASLLACMAACLMFRFFLSHGKSKLSESISTLAPRPGQITVDPNANSPTLGHFDAISWAQRNEWCIKGQADDRRPLNGKVGASLGSASAQRSAARLSGPTRSPAG